MIISASFRTDIPAFYGEWFVRRLEAGYCRTVNPIGGQIHTIPLGRDAVDGIVFWTKNVRPFLPRLERVAEMGYPFYVQHSITGYPRALENRVPPVESLVRAAWELSRRYGPRAAVWRYDPIVYTSLTPSDHHLSMFTRLARQLEGAVDEVVISFAHIYRKTARNMSQAAGEEGFTWRGEEPPDEEKRALAGEMAEVAAEHGMKLGVCSQSVYTCGRAVNARCVDAPRLSAVAGRPVTARTKGNRPDCLCAESRDVGAYDTCPHGCVYCYAVAGREAALERYRAHDPHSEFLFPPAHVPEDPQGDLFGDGMG